MSEKGNKKKSGFVAIIGRPNVGKSTLMNCLIGKKVSITTRKPQTTRQKILGIDTSIDENYQIVYIDTPGIHKSAKKELNKFLNKEAVGAIKDVELILFVVAGTRFTDEDELVLNKLQRSSAPVILVINKIDLVQDKQDLLNHIEKIQQQYDFVHTVQISAKNNKHINNLKNYITLSLPENDIFYFPVDQKTDRGIKFIVAEIIREQLILALGGEVPYDLAVGLEKYKSRKTKAGEDIIDIGAIIWVARPSHKKIVIGTNGEKLKAIGQKARIALEIELATKVFLKIWIKVKSGWYDDKRALKSLGYDHES